MKAIDILVEEHRVISAVLDCLEKIAQEAEREGRLDAQSANQALEFFRNFADGCHHSKEEDRLFVVMQEKGIPEQGGPIGVMVSEHETGRTLVRAMARAIPEASGGDARAIDQFSQAAFDFTALLREHIEKEDQVLFPMANQVLAGPEEAELLADFQEIEAAAGGQRHSDSIRVAKELCLQYGVRFASDSQLTTLVSEFAVAPG